MTLRRHLGALRVWLGMYPPHRSPRVLAGLTEKTDPRGPGWAIEGALWPMLSGRCEGIPVPGQLLRRYWELRYWAVTLRRWCWHRARNP